MAAIYARLELSMKKITCTLLILAGVALPAFAISLVDIAEKYPPAEFMVAIARVPATDNEINDRRATEVMARSDIARQIRVKMESQTTDDACKGRGGECRNWIGMVIKQTVNEALVDCRVAQSAREGSDWVTVAVLNKNDAAKLFLDKADQALIKAEMQLDKAKAGNTKAAEAARDGYFKAISYQNEAGALGTGRRLKGLDALKEELDRLSSGD